MKIIKPFSLIVVFITFFSIQIFSQNDNPLRLYLGYMNANVDNNLISVASNYGDYKLSRSGIACRVSSPLIGLIPNNYMSIDCFGGSKSNVQNSFRTSQTFTFITTATNYRIPITEKFIITPFVGIGIGFSSFRFSNQNNLSTNIDTIFNSNKEFNINHLVDYISNFGVYADYFFNERIGLSFAADYTLSLAKGDYYNSDSKSKITNLQGFNQSCFTAQLGIVFHLNKKTKP